jgi:hypothetical protein
MSNCLAPPLHKAGRPECSSWLGLGHVATIELGCMVVSA